MADDKKALIQEIQRLKTENLKLLNELKICRDEICKLIGVITSIKKEIRRFEVQINSLKTENEELKNRFARIENHPIGKLALKAYRFLRELKRRRF